MPAVNKFKINSDIPETIKLYLKDVATNKKKSLSSFLSSELGEYVFKNGETSLTADMLKQYDSLPGIGRNNFTFWASNSIKNGFDTLCSQNIRNGKQQSKHFIYSLYYELTKD